MKVPIYGSNSWNQLIEKVIKVSEEATELEALAAALPVAAELDVAIPTAYAAVTNMTASVTKAEGEAVSAALATLVLEVDVIADKVNAILAKLRTGKIVTA